MDAAGDVEGSRMKKLWPVLGLVVLVAFLTREFLPKQIHGPAPTPRIITIRDTIHDTLVIRQPRRVTTDTVQLVVRMTIHDTTFINVGCNPVDRTNLWPVVALDVGKKVGDTTTVNTFSLRTGQGGTSRIYTPGPLLGVWADSTPSPRLLFGPPLKPATVSFWTKVKWAGVGWGACTVTNSLADLLRPR
jgi:hypothetical protein